MLEIFGIYLSLNSVEEWPEYFEETIETWGAIIHDQLLTVESQNTDTLIKVKKVSIDIV